MNNIQAFTAIMLAAACTLLMRALPFTLLGKRQGDPGGHPVSGKSSSGGDHGSADRILPEIRADGFWRNRDVSASGCRSLRTVTCLEEEYTV